MKHVIMALFLSGLAGTALAGADPGGPAAWEAANRGGVRVKDITTIQGVRENQLFGYGLVIGLAGSGDTLRNSPFTEQALEAMLDHLGINVREEQLRTRNVAAVIVTGELPPFAGLGSRIDVEVSSLGDAESLRGGTLLFTELRAADGEVYAVAQGPVSVAGFSAEGEAATLMQGVPTSGRIANGALIERKLPGTFAGDEAPIVLELRNPDFATAVAVADRINHYSAERYGQAVAREDSLRTVTLLRPTSVSAARFMAEIGQLRVLTDAPARVVINESSGTVVIGEKVRINPVAVTHGTLTVRITEFPQVSQPEPFSDGQTELVPRTEVEVDEKEAYLAIVGGADLQMLVRGLNEIGLEPTGIIAILQSIKAAGALQAELLVQ